MCRIRFATAADAETILGFIRALAAYEREPDAVLATVESLRDQLESEAPPFECLIAELDAAPVGFALFFHNYSTWRGVRGIYLEDIFVDPAARRRGVASALLRHVATLARARGCARVDWNVLDWNQPAIEFYRRHGAKRLDDWTPFRLDGDALSSLGEGTDP